LRGNGIPNRRNPLTDGKLSLSTLRFKTTTHLSTGLRAAAMVIPIAMTITASPSIAILIALSASMGVPFVFSTPPNSLAYGQGHIRPRQLFIPGLLLMLIGCGLLTVLGPSLMKLVGIP